MNVPPETKPCHYIKNRSDEKEGNTSVKLDFSPKKKEEDSLESVGVMIYSDIYAKSLI